MQQDILKFNASGKISIYHIINGNLELYITRSNAIMPMAADIVARSIGNFDIAKIDEIRAYNGSTQLGTALITQYNHPNTNEVSYTAIFSSNSFSGTFNKLELAASNMGVFAMVDDLPEGTSKTAGVQMAVSWSITIGA